jgi:CBS domain containing-hemolysin-like protein
MMVERGDRSGLMLQRMKRDVDRPLAAILTLNTFAHTLGAAGVGAQATLLWGEAWIGVVSVIVTLLVLVFSEIIPKTIGAVHAKSLAGFTAWTTHWLIIVMLPFVIGCNWISKLFAKRSAHGHGVSREEIGSFATLAMEGGAIDESEAAIVRNLIALRDVAVEAIMTPRTVVFALPAAQTVRVTTEGDPPRFARVPVVGDSLDDVKGLVHRHDFLQARSEGRLEATLGELARPIHIVPRSAKLSGILSEFLRRHEHLFLVVDEYGGTAGIVTLEDVLETLLGAEIVDETDPAPDMQKLAMELLEARQRSD